MSDRGLLLTVVLGLLLLATGVAVADALTRDEKRFLRRVGCTPAVLGKNECRIVLNEKEKEARPRNMMLDCDFPLTIKPQRSCLAGTCL